ncbi:MAG: DUF6489 family protein [Novosphingobium sp.]|nr:DUF6489 family protein [Novosphingobium sp.]
MKVNFEVDCTPEEARRLLGLPDVTAANEVYVERLTKAMESVGSIDQLQDMAKQIAPMGQLGMKMFQNILESGAAMATGSGSKKGK